MVIDPLNRFAKTCICERIVAPDPHAGNPACATRNGQLEIILVDGFGDHHMLSLRAMIRAFNLRSLISSFEKMAGKNGLVFDPATVTFSLPDEATDPA